MPPDALPSPETGQVMTRGVRPFAVAFKGESLTVDLQGYYPDGGGEGVHVGDDMSVVDAALCTLKKRWTAFRPRRRSRRLRTKLKLSQLEAGALLRVGASAFDKYERGLVQPSGPTIQLIRVLDRHPELADELR